MNDHFRHGRVQPPPTEAELAEILSRLDALSSSGGLSNPVAGVLKRRAAARLEAIMQPFAPPEAAS